MSRVTPALMLSSVLFGISLSSSRMYRCTMTPSLRIKTSFLSVDMDVSFQVNGPARSYRLQAGPMLTAGKGLGLHVGCGFDHDGRAVRHNRGVGLFHAGYQR